MKQNLYQLPSDWEWKALGEVATLINGRAYKKHELLAQGPTPVLRVGNFFSNRGWYYSDLKLSEDKYCQNGDLLYAWSASFGPKIWDGGKVIFHYHIWKVLTSDVIDKYYLFYLLAQDSEDIKSAGNGIAMMHATKAGMEKRWIPLPPLAEQKQIAAILDAADKLRQKDQQLVQHYTALSQSLFLDMFGDPISNTKAWKIMSFDKLVAKDCSLTYGIVQPGDNVSDGVPIVRPVDLTSKFIEVKGLKRISKNISAKFKRTILKGGEILLSVRGSVGAVSIASKALEGANVTRGIVPIWMNSNNMTDEFAFSLIKSSKVQSQLKSLSKGATLIQLNLNDLRALNIICPPIELQNKFTERLAMIEKQKQQAQMNLEKSEMLFNSLLQRAFTGELTANKAA